MSRKVIDLTGQRFGRLVVVERADNLSKKNTRWFCKCDCGSATIVQGGALKNGSQVSCGCFHKERVRTHGMDGTPIYLCWAAMKSRCMNSKHRSYGDYGGRGIKVCERWMSFENFFADMGMRPEGVSLDRIDNNGDYEPDNCKWATNIEQLNNRRSNRVLTFNGKSQTVAEWAREVGMSEITLRSRIRLQKWSVEKALTTPVDSSKSSNNPPLM